MNTDCSTDEHGYGSLLHPCNAVTPTARLSFDAMRTDLQSRREFVKTVAAAVAGAPLAAAAGAQPNRQLGVALVGLGSLSANQIAPALRKTRYCRLAGVVTGTPEKGARWKAQHGLPDRSVYSYATMERMAENPDIDIVYVVTPNALHAEHTIKAARAGKHVLCEKPMEVSTERCEAMIAACRTAGRQLAIAYRLQFEPHTQECVRLAREKVFGGVRLIEASFGFPIGDPAQWRLDRELAGGGPLMDVGIYAIQATRMIAGEEPVRVSAMEAKKSDLTRFREVEESLTWELEFPSGILAHCSTSYKVGGMNRFTAFADRGSFGMDPAYSYGGLRGWRSDGAPLRFDAVDQFAVQLDDFAQCILSGRPTKVPGEEGLRDVRIMMAIYEAARAGRAVRLG